MELQLPILEISMRPCNQCRQPVENNVFVCDDCQRWNEQQTENDSESAKPDDPPQADLSGGDLFVDHSYSILLGIFSCIISALFALVGLEISSWTGFFLGAGIGLLSGLVMFTILIRF